MYGRARKADGQIRVHGASRLMETSVALETVSTGCHIRSCAHRLDEPLEKVPTVVGTRRRFRMKLHREHRSRHVRKAFYSTVIEVTVRDPKFGGALRKTLLFRDREPVILRRDLHDACIQIADRVIPPRWPYGSL